MMKFVYTFSGILNFCLLCWISKEISEEYRWEFEELVVLPSLAIACSLNFILCSAASIDMDKKSEEKKDSIFSLWLKVKKKNLEDQLKK